MNLIFHLSYVNEILLSYIVYILCKVKYSFLFLKINKKYSVFLQRSKKSACADSANGP